MIDGEPMVDDAGFALVENLIAIVILGITVAALLTGILTFVIESARHRDQATANTVLAGATEALLDPVRTPYVSSCIANPYTATDATDGVTLPTGWTTSNIAVTQVRYWNGSTFASTCNDANALRRLQEITVRVTSPDARAQLSLTVVKRGS